MDAVLPELARSVETVTRRPRGSRVPLWTGRVLQLIAITMVVVAFSNFALPEGVYWGVYYFEVIGLSPAPFLFNAVLLFIVGSAAKRRLRAAMIFLILFELPTVYLSVANLTDALAVPWAALRDGAVIDLVASCIAAGFIVMLLISRNQFSARAEPASYLAALAVFAGGLAVAILTGVALSPGPGASPENWVRLLHAATGIYPSDPSYTFDDREFDPGIAMVVSSISALALLLALGVLLRSARAKRMMSEAEELQLRRLLAGHHGQDSLAYFASRHDRSIEFTPDRSAAISYKVVRGVALASGDPLGPESAWDAAIAQWLRTVDAYGWRPAVVAATERGAERYSSHGMRGVALGDEAILHLDDTHADKIVRSPQVQAARGRARRAGYSAQFRRQAEIEPSELAELKAMADTWRQGGGERGFSMALSRFGDPVDAGSLIATAHDREGHVVGLLLFVPWNDDGLSLDLMRRSPAAINGVMDYLVGALVAQGASLGVRRLSLNFAVFRHVLVRGAQVGAGPLLKARRRFVLLLSRRWQLDSLRRANEKYSPDWRPRFVMWSRHTSMGAVLLAVLRAEGFAAVAEHRRLSTHAPRSRALVEALEFMKARERGPLPDSPPLLTDPRALRVLALREAGTEPYPATVPRTHAVSALRASQGAPADSPRPVSITGRVVARRRHGGITFIDVMEDHARIQVIATTAQTAGYRPLTRVDLGDLLSVTGPLVDSRSGERSVAAHTWVLAAKSLRRPPNARTGLRDPEAQVRQRHVHLATSPDAAQLLRGRSRAIRALRDRLLEEDYMEVETPILQRTHGGASARPFRTHINAYRQDLSLRIAPELALKRLIVAGFPRVFEVGRNFRNEGVDSTHNPEFTVMEAYRAYADYTDMRILTEGIIKDMATAVSGAPMLGGSGGALVDVSEPWAVVSVCDALTQVIGVTVSLELEAEVLRELGRAYGVTTSRDDSAGMVVERMYEALIEPRTTLPTFYTDFPADTSPLARPHRNAPGLAERWDLVAFGMELGTAYTELNDPLEQRRRLTAQSLRAAKGDPEAMQLDEEFLQALEYGMPPTGGLGLGLDRIVMAATGATIRQTLAFPFVR